MVSRSKEQTSPKMAEDFRDTSQAKDESYKEPTVAIELQQELRGLPLLLISISIILCVFTMEIDKTVTSTLFPTCSNVFAMLIKLLKLLQLQRLPMILVVYTTSLGMVPATQYHVWPFSQHLKRFSASTIYELFLYLLSSYLN